jgi:hypothetical protein
LYKTDTLHHCYSRQWKSPVRVPLPPQNDDDANTPLSLDFRILGKMIFYQTELRTKDFHSTPPPYPKVISFSDRDSPETREIHTVSTSLNTHKSTTFSCHEKLKPYEILICSQSLSLLKFQEVKSTVSNLMKSLKTWYLVHRIYYSTVGPYHIPTSNSTTIPLSMLHEKYGYTFTFAGQHFDES